MPDTIKNQKAYPQHTARKVVIGFPIARMTGISSLATGCTYALGRATVAIAPDEKTMQVSISDGLGRNVMNATMSGPAATTPYLLLDWG